MGPDLFDSVEPPEVWVMLGSLQMASDNDVRVLTVRIKFAGKRSVTLKTTFPRYAPENQVFAAVSGFFEVLIRAQAEIDKPTMMEILTREISVGVDPF
jgi:hypothetical protein